MNAIPTQWDWNDTVPLNDAVAYEAKGPGTVFIYPASGSMKIYDLKVNNSVIPIDTTENVTFNVVVLKGTHQCWVVGSFSDWNTSIGQMHMIDSTGKLMYQNILRDNTERISVDSWNPGVYTVRVLSNDQNFTTKFIKK